MTDITAIGFESIGAVAGTLALAIWALREREIAEPRAVPAQPAMRFRFRKDGKNRDADVQSGAILGRANDSDVVLDDATVSKRHARVTYDGSVWIEDLSSTNGTFVNGLKIEGTSVLRRGDRIALGTAKIVFLGLGARGRTGSKG